jgi:hypothetical protein
MEEPPFSASRFKMQRAKKFIREIETDLESYRASNPLTVRMDTTQTPPVVALEWTGINPLLGAIIGDAIHNMRTSLDLMAAELVRLKGFSDHNVYFPFSDNAARLDDAIKSKNFDKAGEDAVNLLRSFEPYKEGNKLLRALHDLDIRDKHRALVVGGKSMNVKFGGTYNVDNPAENDLAIISHEVYYIFSTEDGVLSGNNVIQTLTELMELVNRILDEFARMVELRNVKTA